jgi:hypothetical protein
MAEIIDRDLGWGRILKEIRRMDGSYTKIGVQLDDGAKPKESFNPDGSIKKDAETDLYIVAVSNEFGTKDGRIPERSYIRSTADKEAPRTAEMLKMGVNSIYSGKNTVKKVLGAVGLYMVGRIQSTINNMKTPRNAEATRKRKGARIAPGFEVDNPLVDTGQLKQSIRNEEVVRK